MAQRKKRAARRGRATTRGAEQDQAFAAAKRADTVGAIDTFLGNHPESRHTTEALTLRGALVKRDETSKVAMVSDNPAMLKTSVKTYWNGTLANRASKMLLAMLLTGVVVALLLLIGVGTYGFFWRVF
jgi:hypothetical protein